MGEEVRVLKEVDFTNNEELKNLFRMIGTKNKDLCNALILSIRKSGVRMDVFKYLAENIADIKDDTTFIMGLTSIIENHAMGTGWLAFAIRYLNEIHQIESGDFFTLMQEASEKRIPLEAFQEFFAIENADTLKIYGAMDEYIKTNAPEEGALVPEGGALPPVKSSGDAADGGVVDVFDNLLSVVGESIVSEDKIQPVQDRLTEYVNNLNDFVRTLSAYTAEVVRMWDKDKIAIERLKKLYMIQQKTMNAQQKENQALRNEIAELVAQVRKAEKEELQRKVINQKIIELQTFNDGSAGIFGLNMPGI